MTERHSALTDLIEESVPGMSMHTVEVRGLSEEMLRRLDELALQRGGDRSQVIREILTRELGGDRHEMAGQSFDAALAPMRAGFAESGLSEAEAEALLDEGLRAVRAKRGKARETNRGDAARVSDVR